MAIIQCPECKKDVSNTALNCQNCGFKINESTAGKFCKGLKLAFQIPFVIILCLVLYVCHAVSTEMDKQPQKQVQHEKVSA
jgi:hypothetical protein